MPHVLLDVVQTPKKWEKRWRKEKDGEVRSAMKEKEGKMISRLSTTAVASIHGHKRDLKE